MAINSFKMSDLAILAGVSESTVSRALANSPLVGDKTRLKIQKLAEKHGYVIDKRARNLRLKKSGVIAVIVPLLHNEAQSISDPFFLEMLGNLADLLSANEYDLLLRKYTGKEGYGLDVLIKNLSVDGVIVIGQSILHEALHHMAVDYKPMVVWGAQIENQNYITVGSDNYIGALNLVRHLLSLPRRNIAFFGNKNLPEIAPRYNGYIDALTEHGISPNPDLELALPFDQDGIGFAAKNFFETKMHPDAIFAVSDVIAMQVIQILKSKNIDVPKTIAVTGFDDIQLASFFIPALTTVKQNIPKAAAEMVNILLDLIAGKPGCSSTLPVELVIRSSS